VLVIANEDAGSVEREALDAAVAELRGPGSEARPLDVVRTGSRDDLDRVLERRSGRPVVVAGGDGSLNAVVSALFTRGELDACPVGLIPLGTGNDFARGMGIPLDPCEAASMIASGQRRRLDLLVDDQGGIAVNAVHVGVGAEAARAAVPWKPRLGPLAFPVGALAAGLRTTGWRVRVEVDHVTLTSARRKVLMVAIANGPTIAGGFAQLAPPAVPDDGLVDVVVSYAVGPLARLGYAIRLRRGEHLRRADVRFARGRRIAIEGESFPINADGEVSGPVRARSWTVAPAAWDLFYDDRRRTEPLS
jgi:diacylglycerol kinase (ATP)